MSRPRMTPQLAEEKARIDFQTEVRVHRARLDMSQRELSDQVGISAPFMSELLADPDKLSVARLRAIIRALDMDPLPILRLLGFPDKILQAYTAPEDRAAGGVIPLRKYQ